MLDEDSSSKKARLAGKLYVLLDAETWFAPLRNELVQAGVEFEVWNLVERSVDLCSKPPAGVFLSRVSASCHTRGHREAAEYGRQVVLWLLAHGRCVLNGGCPAGAAIDFELSKAKQMQALSLAGLRVPESYALPVPLLAWTGSGVDYAFPTDSGTTTAGEALSKALQRLADVVERFSGPVVLKPNCGGRGVGVTKFLDNEHLVKTLRQLENGSPIPDWVKAAWPVDGVLIVQRLIRPADPAFVTRIEIVGERFGYAQKTDISDGATHLCTADSCSARSRFSLRKDITEDSPIVKQCLAFARQHGLDVAGVEFIEEASTGLQFIYDINPNTNYSPAVQEEAGVDLYAEVAGLCKSAFDGGCQR